MAPEPGNAKGPEAGEERSEKFFVAGDLLTNVGGTIEASVLSTPAMIGMMEHCSSVLAYEALPEGRATVGFEVCVKHVAAALEGSNCIVRAKLREVVEERKLRFDVEVAQLDPDAQGGEGSADGADGAAGVAERTIGVGTHERRVIAVDQLG
jgi:predicted thioesterase